LLKSESLIKPFKDASEFHAVFTSREDLEKKLAGKASDVRRNPQPAIATALALTAQ
jgi:hypothetical protein